MREVTRRLRTGKDGSRADFCALVGLKLRQLHLRPTHDCGDLVERQLTQGQLLLECRLPLGVLEVRHRLRLVEPLRLEGGLCLCLLKRSRLVLGKRGVVQPSDIHLLPKLLTRSGVVRTLRRQTLTEVLRDGAVCRFLCRLLRLETLQG